MYTKIEITGNIKIETGMHIGGSVQFSAIGAIDSPVIRDIESDLPIIPGSSLKGKIRALLARKYNDKLTKKHDEDAPEILRLFGSAAKGKPCRSRLIFSDSILSNMEAFREIGIHGATEIKVENSINRLSAIANPRQNLSKEMLERSRLDNRYVAALELLQDYMQVPFEKIECIERENLTDVQLFDAFYMDFEKILDHIKSEYPDSEILVNISSGTPAMKSALNLIAAMSKHKITALQVTTPYKKENPKDEDPIQYDLESFWACNEDNKKDFEKRCHTFHQVNLLAKLKKEMIVQLVQAYDYHAALAIAEDMKEFLPHDVYALLKAAEQRLMLNLSGVGIALRGTSYKIFPIETAGNKRDIFEYILYLQLRQKQGNYADLIRGITPVILNLLEECLMTNCKIDLKDYCIEKRKGSGQLYLSKEKLDRSETGKEIRKILETEFSGELREDFYKSAQIYPILQTKTSDNTLKSILEKLKNVEKEVRNVTAHQMVSVTEEWIQKKVDLSSKEIVDLLKSLAVYSGIPVKKEYWNSYDDMNQRIIEKLCL